MPWNVGSTPKTVGVSANGFGISFDGVKRLRAVDAPTPSTVDWITRRSARRQPRRDLPQPLERLLVRRRPRFDDQVADAHRLDHRHHLLLRAGADRQHRDHRGDAEDHAEHGQQRAQLVREQVVDAHRQRGQHVARDHRRPPAGAAAGMAGPRRCRCRRTPRRAASDRPARSAVPSATPSTTAEVSVLPSTLTGVGVKPLTLAAAHEHHRAAVALEHGAARDVQHAHLRRAG